MDFRRDENALSSNELPHRDSDDCGIVASPEPVTAEIRLLRSKISTESQPLPELQCVLVAFVGPGCYAHSASLSRTSCIIVPLQFRFCNHQLPAFCTGKDRWTRQGVICGPLNVQVLTNAVVGL